MEPAAKLPDSQSHSSAPISRRPNLLEMALFNEQGFRTAWPTVLFLLLNYFFVIVFGSVAWATGSSAFHLQMNHFGVLQEILTELAVFAALLAAGFIAARMDGRQLTAYSLIDNRMWRHAFTGAVAGFAALSLLTAGLCLAGVLHLSYAHLTAANNLRFALLWGFGFLLVGLTEEGTFRCFLLGTLARGMNFWWALVALAIMTAAMLTNADRHGAGGVYAAILAGIGPCFWAEWRKLPSSQFWQAAWATSAGFGFVHTYNPGETAVGIFSAALIGFTFCVSIWLIGSAWWAISFHAAWDWAQTYFYGTPDSGLIPEGHLFASTATGQTLWSGGEAGPEGSLFVIPVTLLVLAALLFVYRDRWLSRQTHEVASPAGQAQLS